MVNVSDVTIDLGGFSIIGVPSAGAGIVAVADENVSVRNGTFRDWPTYGVFLPFVKGCEGNVLGVVLNRKKYYIPDFLYRRV